jgi:uracil-DNA glycosylase family 4
MSIHTPCGELGVAQTLTAYGMATESIMSRRGCPQTCGRIGPQPFRRIGLIRAGRDGSTPTALGRLARMSGLERLADEIVACRRCPRLVEWRERVARDKRAAFADDDYWGKPVPGFGDPRARILVVGLAPAAHGANRTGRMFTGDRSGDWLYRALHRAGLASQAESRSRDDGLTLHKTWVTAPVRCAPPGNKPTSAERDECIPWLERELDLLADVEVIVCLGGFAWGVIHRMLIARGIDVSRPRPKFAHGAVSETTGPTILASYHVSQQNTFTGRLTEDMLDSVVAEACRRAGLG